MKTCRCFVLGLTLCFLAASAEAVIRYDLPLKKMMADAEFVVVAKVSKFSPETPSMSLTLDDDLKGKLPFRKLNINLAGDDEAAKLKHTPDLLKRLAKDLPLVLFIQKLPGDTGRFSCLVYTNGTWFNLVGARPVEGADAAVWKLTHGEPYLRKTYKGSTAELRKVVSEYVKDDGPLPDVNKKEEPGFGPEVK